MSKLLFSTVNVCCIFKFDKISDLVVSWLFTPRELLSYCPAMNDLMITLGPLGMADDCTVMGWDCVPLPLSRVGVRKPKISCILHPKYTLILMLVSNASGSKMM